MLNQLIDIDQTCLVAINAWHAQWADTLMWIISGKWTWLPLYVVLMGLIVWKYRKGKKDYDWKVIACVLIGFAVAVGGADWISHVIKHTVCRLRPTHEPAIMDVLHIVRGYRGGMYGFVSSHAADTMACAMLFSLLWATPYRKQPSPMQATWIGVLMLWVALNCYSRMYLGVHYPGDIIGGLLVGSITSVAVYLVLRKVVAVDN